MTFRLIGASHKTASLELREKMTLPWADGAAALRRVRRECALDELVILSTCNRLEFYFCGDPGGLVTLLSSRGGFPAREAANVLYQYDGLEAATHLFSVAAGLDAMIVGETEVLSQCKTAYEAALSAGVTGPVLNAAFQHCFVAAKKVHSLTRVSRGRTSVGSIAAGLVKSEFGGLKGRSLLVIGAGTMARNALENLSRLTPDRIFVANRSTARGSHLAALFGARAVRLSSIPRLLGEADVVVASASSPSYILTRKTVGASQKERGGKPCLMIDIAVPRNIELSAAEIEGVRLLNIDSLQVLADRNARTRAREMPKARRIVSEEAEKLMEQLAQRRIVPVIEALEKKLECLASREVKKALRHLKSGGAPEAEVRKLAESLAGKFLHAPLSALKRSAGRGDAEALAGAARELHGLGDYDQTEGK